MKAKTILDTEKKDAIDIATELCYSEEVKRKIAQAKSVYEIGRILKQARLMHIHRNPHHWQHWVLINDEPKEGTILIEMPYPYIIEMVCDWWAFSWIKGDLSEMFAWYKDHEAYIKLHNNTRSIVEEILEMIRTKLTEVENAEN